MGGGPASEADTSVACRVTAEFPKYDAESKHEVHFVVSVEAPEAQDDDSRVPLAASCVIDKSGSMEGEKITLVKQTMQWVGAQLRASEDEAAGDALGVVSFDSCVEDTFPMQALKAESKDQVFRALETLQAGTCTNLSGGLFRGLQSLQGRKNPAGSDKPRDHGPMIPLPVPNVEPEEGEEIQQQQHVHQQVQQNAVPNMANHPFHGIMHGRGGGYGMRTGPGPMRTQGDDDSDGAMEWEADVPLESDPLKGREMVKSVLLFTDGLANEGVTDARRLQGAVRKMLERSPGARVSTFGFGADHDPAFLQGLAEAGGGEYYFVEDADQIPATFANALGGLMSVTSQNVVIDLLPGGEGVTVRRPHTRFPVESLGSSGGWRVRAGDLFSEEKRDLLVAADVDPLAAPPGAGSSTPLVRVELSYMDVLGGELRDAAVDASIARPPAGEGGEREASMHVVKHRCRVAAAGAMEAAARPALNLEEKRAALRKATDEIRLSPAASDPLCVALLEDLTDLLNDMSTREEFERVGSKKSHAMSAGWHQQRSRAKKGKADFYSNKAQSATMQAAAASPMFVKRS